MVTNPAKLNDVRIQFIEKSLFLHPTGSLDQNHPSCGSSKPPSPHVSGVRSPRFGFWRSKKHLSNVGMTHITHKKDMGRTQLIEIRLFRLFFDPETPIGPSFRLYEGLGTV